VRRDDPAIGAVSIRAGHERLAHAGGRSPEAEAKHSTTGGSSMDYRLELIVLPVADVDRAKAFYAEQVGFTLDVDSSPAEGFRVVQLTPRGSGCSITVGTGLIKTPPGSVQGLHLVVEDIEAARAELVGRGVGVSPIRHFADGAWQEGADPQHQPYASFADFSDPDGNSWVLQEVRRG